MRQLRTWRAAAILSALALAVTACGGDEGEEGEGLVGIGLTSAGTGDYSFNDAAAAGAKKIEDDLGLKTQVTVPKAGQEGDNLKLLADAGANPIEAIGFDYATSIKSAADANPEIHYAVVDDSSQSAPNLASLIFAEEQGSYLMGAICAYKTKTNGCGFIGAQDIPLLRKFMAGFEQGATETAAKLGKTVAVQSQWIGTGSETFSQPDKAKVIADSMVEKGADVLYHAAGGSGGGMFEACKAHNVSCLGVDSDQYQQYADDPDTQKHIISSMIKKVETAIYDFTKSNHDGNFKAGIQMYDLKAGGVDYSKSGGMVDDIAPDIDKIKQEIIDGKITVKKE